MLKRLSQFKDAIKSIQLSDNDKKTLLSYPVGAMFGAMIQSGAGHNTLEKGLLPISLAYSEPALAASALSLVVLVIGAGTEFKGRKEHGNFWLENILKLLAIIFFDIFVLGSAAVKDFETSYEMHFNELQKSLYKLETIKKQAMTGEISCVDTSDLVHPPDYEMKVRLSQDERSLLKDTASRQNYSETINFCYPLPHVEPGDKLKPLEITTVSDFNLGYTRLIAATNILADCAKKFPIHAEIVRLNLDPSHLSTPGKPPAPQSRQSQPAATVAPAVSG